MRRRKKDRWKRPTFKSVLRSFRLRLLLKICVILAIFTASAELFRLIERELDQLQIVTPLNSQNIHIQVVSRNQDKQSKLQADVIAFVKSTFVQRKHLPLRTLSHLIQRTFSAEAVSAITLNHESIYIRIKPRHALFTLSEIPHMRLSDRGDAYLENPSYTTPLLTLTGLVLGDAKTIKTTHTGTVVLEARRQEAAHVAISLLNSMEENGLDYTQFQYIDHRGFSLSGSPTRPTIIIGEKNFGERFKRLKALLSKSTPLTVATRIELDYDDKAFVLEKNL